MTREFPANPDPSPLLSAEMGYVPAVEMQDFRRAEWTMLRDQRRPFDAALQARHVLRALEDSAADPAFGYLVNNYRHCVQAATAALQDGRDEEYVVVALLHDIGFTMCPSNHGPFAAALLGPYVSDASRWLLEHHQLFLDFHCHDHPDEACDRDARERWRGHPHFAATAEFVARFDQGTVIPGLPEAPLSVFAPMVARIFARPPRRLSLRDD
ncbi:phosphohydrolase [Roseomonas sp. AR75]|uniref:phosphohydrolase n=1 Tax=Roseomonas sp. AR75 TaxID=2562311 RepID=UPI0010BFC0D3|nr:phosphohydrolase [Roseomonas sp. AR75]